MIKHSDSCFLIVTLNNYSNKNSNWVLNYERTRKNFLLRTVDTHWMDHIDAMDQLRSGIGLRAFGQKDPVIEYKFEGYTMFEEMTNSIQQEALKKIFSIHRQTDVKKEDSKIKINAQLAPDDVQKPKTSSQSRVGRNDLCPCGSGKKYKKCCGA